MSCCQSESAPKAVMHVVQADTLHKRALAWATNQLQDINTGASAGSEAQFCSKHDICGGGHCQSLSLATCPKAGTQKHRCIAYTSQECLCMQQGGRSSALCMTSRPLACVSSAHRAKRPTGNCRPALDARDTDLRLSPALPAQAAAAPAPSTTVKRGPRMTASSMLLQP